MLRSARAHAEVSLIWIRRWHKTDCLNGLSTPAVHHNRFQLSQRRLRSNLHKRQLLFVSSARRWRFLFSPSRGRAREKCIFSKLRLWLYLLTDESGFDLSLYKWNFSAASLAVKQCVCVLRNCGKMLLNCRRALIVALTDRDAVVSFHRKSVASVAIREEWALSLHFQFNFVW